MDQLFKLTISASSAKVTAKSVTAEQIYPIMTPQTTRDAILLTRPDSRSTSPVATMAPPKAPRIMARELTGIPLPRQKIIRNETASSAPEEIPRTKGLAMGLAKKV